jgi:flagellar biosynthesis/type III secretory pathway protein FliH
MNMNPKENRSSAGKLNQLIRHFADRENDEREKLTKRYTTSADEREAASYERGYQDGFRDGCQDCWGKGFDEGLKQAAQEQKDKETEEELG